MRAVRFVFLLLLLAAASCHGGEVPDPLFWGSDAEFLEQVESGQFIDRLELHLLQYASDPSWRFDWAAARYAGNGLFGEWGSTTGTELYVNSQIALNLFPLDRLQVRYDRREYQDGRFDVSDQRFDVLWYAGSGWAVALSGWPAFDKEEASLGLGIRVGAPKARNSLELRVVNDLFVWNEKSGGEVRFTRRPIRILVDGSLGAGPWRVRGSADLGLEYEAADGGENGIAPVRSTRGFQRSADLEGEYAGTGWAAGARLTAIVFERSQSGPGADARFLDRSWGRAVGSIRKDLGKWTISALAGWASQRDDFASPDEPAGAYSADALLVGVEGSLQASRALQLRLGYLGSSQQAERDVSGGGPLPQREEDGYIDKAHVRAVWVFRPRMSIELLLSQALRGGSFGGGSIKALFVF
jgi:hypothetical protein